jgi:hypothetical protein
MLRMNLLLGIGAHTGARLAEVGFLLIVFAGVWLAAAQMPQFRFATGRTIVAGIALAASGVLLIIATHWGKFG